MQRLIISLVTIMVLGACGSSDDSDAGATTGTPVTTEPTTSEASADDTAGAPDDSAAGDDAVTDTTAAPTTVGDEQPSDDATDPPEEEPADDLIEVDSFTDLPPECVDLLREFLRDIEPVVSAIDWQQATIAEFESLGTDFEDVSRDFDAESTRLGCDRFDLTSEDAGFDEMIEFAESEAPGTVAFFEFLDGIRNLLPDASDDGSAAGGPGTCDDAVAEIESLADEYGQMTNVPASELARIGQLMSSLTTVCSIAELDTILERQDIADFLDS